MTVHYLPRADEAIETDMVAYLFAKGPECAERYVTSRRAYTDGLVHGSTPVHCDRELQERLTLAAERELARLQRSAA